MTTDNDISKAANAPAEAEYGTAPEKDKAETAETEGTVETEGAAETEVTAEAAPDVDTASEDTENHGEAEKHDGAEAPAGKAAPQPATLRYMAVGGAVCALLAWAFLVFSEWVSISFDVAAIALSAVACRLRPGNMRNLAITALVAAGTLALVFATLFVLLHILENL